MTQTGVLRENNRYWLSIQIQFTTPLTYLVFYLKNNSEILPFTNLEGAPIQFSKCGQNYFLPVVNYSSLLYNQRT